MAQTSKNSLFGTTTLTGSKLRGSAAFRGTAMGAVCLAVTACQTTQNNEAASLSAPRYSETSQEAPVSQAVQYWADRFKANPHDINAAVGLSRELRRERKYDESLGILLRATAIAANDPYLLSEMGKTLIERGSPNEGLKLLEQAANKLPSDWSIMSARGIALDQLEEYQKAQDAYQMALTYSPGNPVILANYGLSLATQGRLGEAENMLRKAAAHPDASKAVKLNLALILGLKGDFEESESIARAHLPPATVEENMAYLRSLLTQPARWRRPTDGDYDGENTMPANMPS